MRGLDESGPPNALNVYKFSREQLWLHLTGLWYLLSIIRLHFLGGISVLIMVEVYILRISSIWEIALDLSEVKIIWLFTNYSNKNRRVDTCLNHEEWITTKRSQCSYHRGGRRLLQGLNSGIFQPGSYVYNYGLINGTWNEHSSLCWESGNITHVSPCLSKGGGGVFCHNASSTSSAVIVSLHLSPPPPSSCNKPRLRTPDRTKRTFSLNLLDCGSWPVGLHGRYCHHVRGC